MQAERELGNDSFLKTNYDSPTAFTNTSKEFVYSRMPSPENVVIKKGFLPDTFVGVDCKFCFVSLDMDLYKPMLDAMKFFWDRLTPCGVMLLHDYYVPELEGVKKAVEDFECEIGYNVKKSPVRDNLSLAVFR